MIRYCTHGLLFLCLAWLPVALQAASLTAVRCAPQPSGDYRVVLDFDAAPRLTSTAVVTSTQHRILLPGASFTDASVSTACDPAWVADMAWLGNNTADAAVQLQTPETTSGTLFVLSPAAGKGHRVVFDISPAAAVKSTAVAAMATEGDSMAGDDKPPQPGAGEVAAVSAPQSRQPAPADAAPWRMRGYVSAEARIFPRSAQFSGQRGSGLSFAVEPEWFKVWQNDSLSFRPFLRWDQQDTSRSHADLRELLWAHQGDGWELAAGVGKVYWGVTEAYHLVDVINQTDLVENPDGEQKLGQPMIKLAMERDWGTVTLFALPGFRERTYPGVSGRLRSERVVDTDHPQYRDGRGPWSWDWALRWSHYIDNVDFAVAHFHGTGRDPSLVPGIGSVGQPVLIPVYERIDQSSVEVQLTQGDWLWKFEALHRSGQGSPYSAFTGGFEYTLVGVVGTAADLGLLTEVMYDSRGAAATTPFNRDVFVGARWVANDVAGSELLFGVITDWNSGAKAVNLEASRRFGQRWKLSLQARGWYAIPADDPQAGVSRDSYIETTLSRYF